MATDSPLRCIESFPRETQIVVSLAGTPIDVSFNDMFSDCWDICKSDVVCSRAVLENVT